MGQVEEVWQQRRFTAHTERKNDHRSPYQRDKARILHSAAFRRLQAKTQVLGIGMNDFYRTRLTHSLEAAQIGTGLTAQLRQKHPDFAYLLSDHLIEALCLAHDLGHPPFGHGGEVALNYMMRDHGGFEGNGQTFRILARLEPYTQEFGMDLTRRTLLGVLKYPASQSQLERPIKPATDNGNRHLKVCDWPPVKAIFDDDRHILDWVLQPLPPEQQDLFQSLATPPNQMRHGRTQYKSLDCSIMELADDIAYSVHDLEDAIVLGIVQRDKWFEEVVTPLRDQGKPFADDALERLSTNLFCNEHYRRKDAIGTLVNGFVTNVELSVQHTGFDTPLLTHVAKLHPDHNVLLETLKTFVLHNVIRKPEVQLLEFKGQQMVMELFEAFESDPARLLPSSTAKRWQKRVEQGHSGNRVLADYISGMTDEFAARLHENLFTPRSGNLFELQSRL